MTCDRAMQSISAELDGELSEKQAAALKQHLEDCENCRALRRDLQQIEGGVAALEQEKCADLRECVMRRVRREPREEKVKKNGALAALSVAAAIVIVVFPAIGFWEKFMPDQNAADIAASTVRDTGYAQNLADSYGCGILVVWGDAGLPEEGSADLDDGSILYPVDEETVQKLQKNHDTQAVYPADEAPIRFALVFG